MTEKNMVEILIIDDDREDAMILQRYAEKFSDCKAQAQLAEDLDSALGYLNKQHFDIILSHTPMGVDTPESNAGGCRCSNRYSQSPAPGRPSWW